MGNRFTTNKKIKPQLQIIPGTEANFSTLLFQPFHRRYATHYFQQEVSYRKQIARQLSTQ